jgi:low affinity Fe/Cu permease
MSGEDLHEVLEGETLVEAVDWGSDGMKLQDGTWTGSQLDASSLYCLTCAATSCVWPPTGACSLNVNIISDALTKWPITERPKLKTAHHLTAQAQAQARCWTICDGLFCVSGRFVLYRVIMIQYFYWRSGKSIIKIRQKYRTPPSRGGVNNSRKNCTQRSGRLALSALSLWTRKMNTRVSVECLLFWLLLQNIVYRYLLFQGFHDVEDVWRKSL